MTADELRAARIALGWSQAKLAGALDVTATFISLMEGSRRPIQRCTELAVRYLLAQNARAA